MENSIVDSILSKYGFIWKTNPYNIETKNGYKIQSNLRFDLRESTLKKQYKAHLNKQKSYFSTQIPNQK